MSFLFGSAPSVQNVPVTLQSSLSQQQGTVQDFLYNLFSQGSQGIFPQSQPGISPIQSSAIYSGATATPGIGTAASTVGGLDTAGQNTLEGILGSTPQNLNSYYNTNVLQPLNQTLQQVTLPSIMASSGGSAGGYQSTSQSSAIDQAVNNFSNTLAATQGGLAYQTGQANTANQLTAAGLVPAAGAAPIAQAAGVAGLGNQQTVNQWAQYTAAIQNIQQAIADQLQYMGVQTETPANQAVAQGGQSGALGGLLQGLGGNTALGSGLMSLLGLGGGTAGAVGGGLPFAGGAAAAGGAAGGGDFLSLLAAAAA